jgi:hypothetical protein
MPIGNRLHTPPRYIKHPGVATAPLQHNQSFDAGSLAIIHNNLAHLSYENKRHIANLQGPGRVYGYDPSKPTESGYSLNSLVDVAAPADVTDPDYDMLRIAWLDGYDCVSAGPIFTPCVDLSTDPAGYKPRGFALSPEITRGAVVSGSIYTVCAVTLGSAPPNVNAPLVWEKGPVITTAGTNSVYGSILYCPPIRPSRRIRCRPDGAVGRTHSNVLDLYVWMGWFSTSYTLTAADRDFVHGVEIHELF